MAELTIEFKKSETDSASVAIILDTNEIIALTDTLDGFFRGRKQYMKYGMIPKRKPKICEFQVGGLKCTHTLPGDSVGVMCNKHC